jgi:hypothetical protein
MKALHEDYDETHSAITREMRIKIVSQFLDAIRKNPRADEGELLNEATLPLSRYDPHSSFVHVPQPLDWKPASVGAMATIVGLLVLPLAIMAFRSPLKPLNLS